MNEQITQDISQWIDPKRVTAAVKIKISLERMEKKKLQLEKDLVRLRHSMNHHEYNEYMKRILHR